MTEVNTDDTVQAAPEQEVAQPEQVVTTEEVTDSPEIATVNEEKLYAGKFKSPEELERSYEELQSKFTRERQAVASPPVQQQPDTGSEFDPDTDRALELKFQKLREQEKTVEFQRKYADDLKDPLVAGATQRLIQEANSQGEYLSQEEALSKAKQLIEARVKPAQEQAAQKGVEEGKELSRKKEQLGAVGESGKHSVTPDDELTAAELAAQYNLPRIN